MNKVYHAAMITPTHPPMYILLCNFATTCMCMYAYTCGFMLAHKKYTTYKKINTQKNMSL